MVLVFLQLFSLSSLYVMLHAANAVKRSHHHWLRDRYLQLGHVILRDIERGFLERYSTCSIPASLAESFIKKPVSWWKQQACSDKVGEVDYYYVVENLGQHPCHVIISGNHDWVASYHRVTLLMLPDKMRGAKILLQTTFVTSTGELSACTDKRYRVFAGRQLLREL
jgi:hypothetical protein